MSSSASRDPFVRLAFVDPQSYHNLAKYDVKYLQGLADAGFRGGVRFYCSRLIEQPAPEGVEMRPIFCYNRQRVAAIKILSYAASMARLSMEALRKPADVYHFQWLKFPPLDWLIVLVLRRLAHARVVLTAHNVVPHDEENARHRSLGRIYREVDRIVVHHAATAEEIARRFSVEPARFAVLPHGLTDLEARGTSRHDEEVARFAAEHEVNFCFFGRGSRYKGLDVLLRAWREVADSTHGRAGLIVMGALDRELKPLAERTARDTGGSLLVIDEVAEEADLFHAVRKSDVVVLPHRRISQSGALLSVLGLRVPFLVSQAPGLLEPLEIGRIGWSFDGSQRGLTDRLVYLVEHPDAVTEARGNQAGWEAVARHYDWARIAGRGIEVYHALMRA